jgi:hypothetical protein
LLSSVAALGLLALAAASFAAGCKGAAEPGSCTVDVLNVCTEYAAATSQGGRRTCGGGVWRAGAASCPAQGLIGLCTLAEGIVEHRYAGPPNNFTPAGSRRSCEVAGGSWRDR